MGYHLKAETFQRVGFILVSNNPANELILNDKILNTERRDKIDKIYFKDVYPLFRWNIIRFHQVKGSRCHLASLRFINTTVKLNQHVLIKELLNHEAIEAAKEIRKILKTPR